MKALIVGKNGQVAWELQQTCPAHVQAKAVGREDIDITNPKSIEAALDAFKPDVIINAAAYTAVDKAESDKDNAYLINATAVEYLAKAAKQHGIRLIHISTDFVFDGTNNTPYHVDDTPNPINVYGASKLAGEKAVLEYYPENSAIVRTSWVYSSHGNNFVKTMLRLMAEKDELNVVSDQIGCPTNAKGLAQFLWQLVEQESLNPIYHYSDLGVASWYDFAIAIQEIALAKGLLEKKIPIKPIASALYPTPAKRPTYSLMQLSQNGKHWRLKLQEVLA